MKKNPPLSNYSPPKKILHITGGMNQGGAENMIMNIFRNMNDEVVKFDFLSITDVKRSEFDHEIINRGGNIFYLNSFRFSQPFSVIKFIINIVKLMKENGPYHAIHAHTLFNIGWIVLAGYIAKIDVRVAHAHSTRDTLNDSLLRKAYQQVMRFFILKFSTTLVSCGEEAGRFLYGTNKSEKIKVIPNAIDLNSHLNISEKDIDKIKVELNINKDTLVIGQVGNLKEVKNHRFSLLIAEKLVKKGMDFKMIFVGDGDLKGELSDYVIKHGLDSNVKFIGLRNDVNVLLKSFDLFLMPSLYEGLPLALIEAQATGLPCLISNKITREADLGLGIIRFLDLENINCWIEEISLINSNKNKLSEQIIKEKFKEFKYDVKNNSDIYFELYNLRGAEIEQLQSK